MAEANFRGGAISPDGGLSLLRHSGRATATPAATTITTAFCRPLLMGWRERNGVGYAIGLAKNSRLHALSASWCSAAETAFEGTRLPRRHFGEFAYQAGTIRVRSLKLGAVIVRDTRRMRFFPVGAFPRQDIFRLAAKRIMSG